MFFPRVLGAGCALLALSITSSAHGQAAPDTSAVARATEAGTAWLSLVDAGQFEASWDSAAPALQQAMSKADWVQALTQARAPFEPFGKRTLAGTEFRATIPNAPPGPYVILGFQTVVPGNHTVTETVVPMRLGDGSWRVSGYFIRPES